MREESLPSIPTSILTKIYDHTGSEDSGNRGFILFYVNSEGSPMAMSKTENSCVSLALRKTIEMFLEENTYIGE